MAVVDWLTKYLVARRSIFVVHLRRKGCKTLLFWVVIESLSLPAKTTMYAATALRVLRPVYQGAGEERQCNVLAQD